MKTQLERVLCGQPRIGCTLLLAIGRMGRVLKSQSHPLWFRTCNKPGNQETYGQNLSLVSHQREQIFLSSCRVSDPARHLTFRSQWCLKFGDLRSKPLAGPYRRLRTQTPARTSKERDQREQFQPLHAENHARDNKIASKKGLKIAEKTPQAYF